MDANDPILIFGGVDGIGGDWRNGSQAPAIASPSPRAALRRPARQQRPSERHRLLSTCATKHRSPMLLLRPRRMGVFQVSFMR